MTTCEIDSSRPIARSREFLEECWAELKKVHWPTRDETRAATIAVVIGVVVVALYLGLVDFVLSVVIHAGAQLMTRRAERQWYVVHTYSGYEHKVKAVARGAHPRARQAGALRRDPRARPRRSSSS